MYMILIKKKFKKLIAIGSFSFTYEGYVDILIRILPYRTLFLFIWGRGAGHFSPTLDPC